METKQILKGGPEVCDNKNFLKEGEPPPTLKGLGNLSKPIEALREDIRFKRRLQCSPHELEACLKVGPKDLGVREERCEEPLWEGMELSDTHTRVKKKPR